jgi:hypothetical protein
MQKRWRHRYRYRHRYPHRYPHRHRPFRNAIVQKMKKTIEVKWSTQKQPFQDDYIFDKRIEHFQFDQKYVKCLQQFRAI